MLDIKEKRHITVVGRGGASNIDWDDIENKPDFATVATSGSYNDLTDKPEIPGQVNADWDATSGVSQILNKPNLATVATSGSYDDLSDKPTIPAAQVNSDWDATSGVAQILNKPELASVATSGSYNDLTDKPDLTHYVEDTDLATVATSGSYNDLSDKPTIPSAQVNADWNASSGVQQILNKPTLATVATTGSYNDLSDKPEIPSVPAMATQELTFTLQGGATKTIEFYTVPNYFYVEDISGSNNTLIIKKTDSLAPDVEVFYSTDKMNWTNMGTTSTTGITATIPANGKLYLKAVTSGWGNPTINPYNYISASGNHNVGGNIMSLSYGDNFEGKTTFQREGVFKYLFSMGFDYNNTLISAEKLILPATTFNICYANMFYNCRKLTTAPTLPATTLTPYCYQNMFKYCNSLNKVVIYANNISAISCLNNWLNDVSAQGDFYNLGNPAPTYPSGESGIPEGWTEHTSL